MKACVKITSRLLDAVRADLHQPHSFAYERVGFLIAGCTYTEDGNLLLLCRDYAPVADEDYVRDHAAGAVIGSNAMRKGLQAAFKNRSALLHIHTHGGMGRPEFSGIDLRSSEKFVPSFFNVIPQMPHGIFVLSDNSARGLIWHAQSKNPVYVDEFVRVGARYERFGGRT